MNAALATLALLTATLAAAGSGLALVEGISLGSQYAQDAARSAEHHAQAIAADPAGSPDLAQTWAEDGAAMAGALASLQTQAFASAGSALAGTLVHTGLYAKTQGEFCLLDAADPAVDAAYYHDAPGVAAAGASAADCEARLAAALAFGTQAGLVSFANGLVQA